MAVSFIGGGNWNNYHPITNAMAPKTKIIKKSPYLNHQNKKSAVFEDS
jgi:diphthamide synthase subunit DPH2